MSGWREIWRELWTPSARGEGAYLWALLALAHATLGAAAITALALVWAPGPLAPSGLALAYLVLKEGRDLGRGGRLGDGLVDAGFVALGLHASLVPAWPALAVILISLALMLRPRVPATPLSRPPEEP